MATTDVAEAGALYGLPLDEFTNARNDLAAKLRKAGDKAAAERVKSLPKPSSTAWALNQVARSQPALVDSLLSSADELRRAQQQLLAGRNNAPFREATQHERQAVNAVVRAAAEVLAKEGRPASKATLDRLEATARAAAAGEENGELLRSGTLSRDLDPSGFGSLAGAFGFPADPFAFPARATPAPEGAPPAEAAAAEARHAEARQDELANAQVVVRGLQEQLAAFRKEAAEAERAAASARQAAAKADGVLAAAREAVERAEKDAARAHRARDEAAQDLAAIRARIDQTAEQLEQAEEALRALRG
jgi:hypothetical protein